MIYFLFVFLFSCVKSTHVEHIERARKSFEASSCLDSLKKNILDSDCTQMYYSVVNEFNIVIRCHKDDKDRGKFWDNYFFMISPSYLEYDVSEQILVAKHTICLDNQTRIQAFPPEEK
ncbi:MAG: hypothetical protein CBC29_06955 [Methylococcaceae bacterium TMED69]|nr:MAG: hypothetical protein CBC29_06955 [Methylococcaceae bacterium TMED69]|tara:strand:+ start:266 stop:619 length:354 start_codon:yes stop_codon:yes gene_type:complete